MPTDYEKLKALMGEGEGSQKAKLLEYGRRQGLQRPDILAGIAMLWVTSPADQEKQPVERWNDTMGGEVTLGLLKRVMDTLRLQLTLEPEQSPAEVRDTVTR